MPVTERFKTKDAYYRWYWADKAQPSTPAQEISSYFTKNRSPSSTIRPDMAYSQKGRQSVGRGSARHSMASNKSYNSAKTGRTNRMPSVSVRDLSINEEELESPSSMNEKYTRWSWTNSEAPLTPKLHFEPKRSSSSSSQKYKPIGSLAGYQMEAIDENSVSASPSIRSEFSTYTKKSRSGGMRTFFHKDGPS